MSSFSDDPNSERNSPISPSTRACSAWSRSPRLVGIHRRPRVAQPPARRSSSTSAASASSSSSCPKRSLGVVELEQALGVERADGRQRRGFERGAQRVVVEPRGVDRGGAVAQLGAHRQHPAEQPLHLGRGGRPRSPATRLGSPITSISARGNGSSSSHFLHAEAVGADGGEQVAAVGRAGGLDDAGDGPDAEARCHHRRPRSRARSARRRSGRRRGGTSRPARGTAPRRCAAAARRAGTARCRAGTSASASPSGHRTDAAGVSWRAARQARRRRGSLLAALTGKERGQHVELARRLRELPEAAQQAGQVAAPAQRDPRDRAGAAG